MKGLFRYLYIFIAAIFAFAGCSEGSESAGPMQKMAVEFDLNFVGVAESGEGTSKNGVLDDYFIDGRSVIIISQRGTSLSINFNDYTIDNEGNQTENENLYKYVYYTNTSADWDNYYNFQPYGNRALDWAYMERNSLNGEYALGALYYPVGYNVYNSVEQDQSSYENLLRSNVLGAWHRTYATKTRLRFAFYHLMEAIRVTLLIPDWNPEDNSGFGADAVESAAMLGMIKDFSIDWSLDNSTETSPHAQYLREGVEPCDIIMYPESVDNDVRRVRYNDITSSFPDDEESVRTATFVVLFPPQQPAINAPAMRFILKTMGGQEKSYVWSTNNMYDNPLRSEGGLVNNLTLYLPRKANNAILIKAHILDWVDADSQFTVIPDDVE